MSIDAAQLETFAAIVDEGSFDAAAQRLRITPSAVSQRIKALERHIGQVLVSRAKPCRSTEAGQALLRLARQVSLLETEALAAARGQLGATADAGPVRIPIAVNADSLASWFLHALTPDRLVCFDLWQEDQDHSAALLRDGSVLAAVTADPRVVQGCQAQRLGAMRYRAMMSPAYADRWLPEGPAAEALAAAPIVVFNRKDALQHRCLRKLTRRKMSPPLHYIPAAVAFVDAVRHGLGWGMVPEQLASGELVELAPGRHVDVPLYWQHWKLDSEILTTLTAAVRTAAANGLR